MSALATGQSRRDHSGGLWWRLSGSGIYGAYNSGSQDRQSSYLAQLLQGYGAQLQVGAASKLRGSSCAWAMVG